MNEVYTDSSVALLLQRLQSTMGRCLLVADENWANVNWGLVRNTDQRSIHLVSNRYDIAKSASAAGIEADFNDFDFSTWEPQSFDTVLFRVAKERATSHHVLNRAAELLRLHGQLILTGEKNDGIKTYVKQANRLFGDKASAEKNGAHYLASVQLYQKDAPALDDKNYPHTRLIKTGDGSLMESKPGIFGWDKIDRGSTYLIEYLPQFLARYAAPPTTLLDLGCGYGYLSMQASQQGFIQITGTDNNAAALSATAKNFQRLNIDNFLVAGDAGNQITGRFDTVLCNPPFHQGFSVDGDMAVKFLSATKRLLAESGQALFVVNNFIPLEQKAKAYFRYIDVLANNGSFKLIALSQQSVKN